MIFKMLVFVSLQPFGNNKEFVQALLLCEIKSDIEKKVNIISIIIKKECYLQKTNLDDFLLDNF